MKFVVDALIRFRVEAETEDEAVDKVIKSDWNHPDSIGDIAATTTPLECPHCVAFVAIRDQGYDEEMNHEKDCPER